MKFFSLLLGTKNKTTLVFDDEKGKTIDEYQRELLVKAGREEFEKLHNLGLALPFQLA
jgi:hypothetical protein